MKPWRIRRLLLTAALLTVAFAPGVAAQDYPQKPITMVVPFGAGGGTDIVARLVSEELGKALGQSIVIDSRPGANGAIGSALVSKAAPDGYTLLFTAQSTFSLNPSLMKELPYDQLKDFVPIASILRSPWMLAVSKDSGFNSVEDVIKAAKANPDKLTFGFWQSSVLVTTEIFQKAAGIQLRKVPYKGTVEALNDFVAGRLNLIFIDVNSVKSFVDSGAVKFLAATTPRRMSLLPDVPTMVELGYPSVVTDSMVAVFAPARTPSPILQRLNSELTRIVGTSKPVRDKLFAMGLEPATMNLAEIDAFVKNEIVRWKDMIDLAGLQKE
jgi:tripartite-type tricarboxylate transporter receptor subunit TctC